MIEEQVPVDIEYPVLQVVQAPAAELLQTRQFGSLQLGVQYAPPITLVNPELQSLQADRVVQLAQFATNTPVQSTVQTPLTTR